MPKNSTTIDIHELVQKEVKAQLKRYAMAKRRDDFINSLVDVLIPALVHHYRSRLGAINQEMNRMTSGMPSWPPRGTSNRLITCQMKNRRTIV